MADKQSNLLDMLHLLAPIGAERFFADFWLKRMVAFELDPVFFAQLNNAIGPLDLARLAGLVRGGTQAWIASNEIAHSVVPVDASNAGKFFEAGASLYFVDVPLPLVTEPLCAYLGVPPARMLASFFLTPGRGGASPHFDANENFTIQLTGAKRWTLGEMPMVAAPPEGHVLGSDVSKPLSGILAEKKATPVRTTELKQGTFLYIPRGTLHSTEAGEMSWSLNLSYACTMWVDLVCNGLRRRLAKSPHWRASVTGLANADPAARAANTLAPLITELQAMLANKEELELLCQDFFHADDPGRT